MPTTQAADPCAGRRPINLLAMLAAVVLVGLTSGCASAPNRPGPTAAEVDQRAAIDTLALVMEAADHEALFTLAGGLKPMSTGIWRGSFFVDDPDLNELTQVRAALGALRNDIWYADVQVFAGVYDGERAAHAYVVHRESFSRMIEHHEGYWSPWGVTPCTSPAEVVAVVDRMPKADRWRGYGYLFGYPADAVDFFVDAGLAATTTTNIGPGKDRRFIQIPTHKADSGRFTYAVAMDHVPTAEDAALAANAAWILTQYRDRRERMTSTHCAVRELLRLNQRFEQRSAAPANALAQPYE